MRNLPRFGFAWAYVPEIQFMTIGVLKEITGNKVGLVPPVIRKMVAMGYSVLIEQGAGENAFISDADLEEAGAQVGPRPELFARADILISFNPVPEKELESLRPHTTYLSQFKPYIHKDISARLEDLNIQAFSLDMIPRSSIAQSMDVLSSMASVAGYKAVLQAAYRLPRYFPMMITSAGSVKPARVFVIGAGVAGLQAIATARRLGAIVEAVDTRLETEEEVKSLGGKFLKVEGAAQATAGGYGAQQSEEYIARQRKMLFDAIAQSDVVICTAVIRGPKAPVIVTRAMVEAMRPGSVIIDLAAYTGGNCELTQNNQTITHRGVTIIGNYDLSDAASIDASTLFANNLLHFLTHISDDALQIRTDLEEDEIFASSLIARPKKPIGS